MERLRVGASGWREVGVRVCGACPGSVSPCAAHSSGSRRYDSDWAQATARGARVDVYSPRCWGGIIFKVAAPPSWGGDCRFYDVLEPTSRSGGSINPRSRRTQQLHARGVRFDFGVRVLCTRHVRGRSWRCTFSGTTCGMWAAQLPAHPTGRSPRGRPRRHRTQGMSGRGWNCWFTVSMQLGARGLIGYAPSWGLGHRWFIADLEAPLSE